MPNAHTVTDDQVKAVRAEASASGNQALVAHCDAAMSQVSRVDRLHARAAVARYIEAKEAKSGD